MIPSKEEWMQVLELRHGKERQRAFSNATVAVCGLGGLGSNVAVSLARAGIGKLILMDFDRVDITNLHRQQYKVIQLGRPKVEVMKEHILDFNPTVDIRAFNTMMSKENLPQLLDNHPDFVVDCIDDYSTKTDLLEYCIRNNLEVISSMGSGCRSNTTSLLITNITDVKCTQRRRV